MGEPETSGPCHPRRVLALALHPDVFAPGGPVPHLDPLSAAAAAADRAARAGEALSALAARAREAAADVSVQAEVHRQLLTLDWHGGAAAAFAGVVEVRAASLQRTADRLEALADEAGRRAQLVAGGGW